MDVKKLVVEISPLYNAYKKNDSIAGWEAICLMWKTGEILAGFINKHDVTPNKLYREVYGGGEGSTNIAKKGYISREYLSRCFRIRKMFKSEEEIKNSFPTLKSFNLFREAMPYFDNPKCLATGEDKKNILSLLNNKNTNLSDIRALNKEKLNISNPRTQNLSGLEGEKKIFIDFYNDIFKLNSLERSELKENMASEYLSKEIILNLAQGTRSIAQDGLKHPRLLFDPMNVEDLPNMEFSIKTHQSNDSIWYRYSSMLLNFFEDSNAKRIRRFRKLIPANRIAKLADYLHIISNKLD